MTISTSICIRKHQIQLQLDAIVLISSPHTNTCISVEEGRILVIINTNSFQPKDRMTYWLPYNSENFIIFFREKNIFNKLFLCV